MNHNVTVLASSLRREDNISFNCQLIRGLRNNTCITILPMKSMPVIVKLLSLQSACIYLQIGYRTSMPFGNIILCCTYVCSK